MFEQVSNTSEDTQGGDEHKELTDKKDQVRKNHIMEEPKRADLS